MIFKTFKNGKALLPTQEYTLHKIFALICTDKTLERAQKLLRTGNLSKKSKAEVKSENLLAVSLSANLKTRDKKVALVDKIICHTGYLLLDIDKIPQPLLNPLKDDLADCDYTHAVWTTSSGNGLAVLVKCPSLTKFEKSEIEHEHKTAIGQLMEYYNSNFELPDGVDDLKDVARLRFLSFDPNLLLNEDSKEWEYERKEKPVKSHKVFSINGQFDNLKDSEKKEICDLTRYIVKNEIDITQGGGKWYKIGFIIADAFKESGRSIFQALSQFHPDYNEDETNQRYDYSLKSSNPDRGLTKKTLFYIADQHDINLVKLGLSTPNKPNKSVVNVINDIDIESFSSSSADEILKSAKTFRGHIYNIIPETLKDYLTTYSGRNKDIVLLHTLGIISGLFTNVKVRYGKVERPALYTYILTSSGVGKSLPDRSKLLVKPFDKKLREESAEDIKQWKIREKKAKAEKDYSFMEDKPSQKKLLSSGSVTSAKLLRDLANNKSIIITATEADPIANKMMGVHGSDLSSHWRMCYHQEEPTNETVTDGDIIATDPFLSIALLSTADQLPRVINNIKDGLFSRFCMYGFYDRFLYENPNLQDYNFDYLDKVDKFSNELGALMQFKDIVVTFTEEQNAELTDIGLALMRKVTVFGDNKHTNSLVTRGVVQLTRIAAIMTNLRRLDTGEDTEGKVMCEPYDFGIAVDMMKVIFDMNLKFFASLSDHTELSTKEPTEADNQNSKSIRAFKLLPIKFKTSEAIEAFEKQNLKKSRAEKILRHWLENGLIERDDDFTRGRYKKTDKDI